MSTKFKYWITGIIVAAAGLVLARVISPGYSERSELQIGLFLAGVVVAMAGLGIILAGLKKQ